MKRFVIGFFIVLSAATFASKQGQKRIVLTLEKEQTVSEILWQNGVTNLYDKNGKVGNLRKVLFFNRLSFDKAKKLPKGFKLVIPRVLNHYFITNKSLLEKEIQEMDLEKEKK
jgi:hypothetical protein